MITEEMEMELMKLWWDVVWVTVLTWFVIWLVALFVAEFFSVELAWIGGVGAGVWALVVVVKGVVEDLVEERMG